MWGGAGTDCDDDNQNGVPDICESSFDPEDVNEDGCVNVTDLLQLLGAWGDMQSGPPWADEDINEDGVVNVTDLLQLLGAWGAGC